MYFKYTNERLIPSKGGTIEIMTFDKADEVVQELFESLLSKYKIGLETRMKGSNFIFNCVNLLHYKCHEIILKHGGLYVHSPD